MEQTQIAATASSTQRRPIITDKNSCTTMNRTEVIANHIQEPLPGTAQKRSDRRCQLAATDWPVNTRLRIRLSAPRSRHWSGIFNFNLAITLKYCFVFYWESFELTLILGGQASLRQVYISLTNAERLGSTEIKTDNTNYYLCDMQSFQFTSINSQTYFLYLGHGWRSRLSGSEFQRNWKKTQVQFDWQSKR